MKKIYIIILTTLIFNACKAQTPVVALDASYSDVPIGGYFKDLDNELDKFIGTWVYSQNNYVLTIIFKKETMVFDDEYYEDMLVGEYKFENNGVVIFNSLNLINDPSISSHYHNISGNFILNKNIIVNCADCSPNERRVLLYFNDPERDYLSSIVVLRYLVGTNPPQMTATITAESGVMLPYNDAPTQTRVPYDEYLMTKQ